MKCKNSNVFVVVFRMVSQIFLSFFHWPLPRQNYIEIKTATAESVKNWKHWGWPDMGGQKLLPKLAIIIPSFPKYISICCFAQHVDDPSHCTRLEISDETGT